MIECFGRESPYADTMASASTSPSFASSSMSRRNYGVFLSFRGPDCRYTIVSHLYNALCQEGVYVFKDNEELESGQRRSDLFEAIEGSRVAIVMFSENYARSRWCLDELKKIMDCKDQGKLAVLPIFYRVSPGEVRLHEKENGEKGCYQAAMEEMEAMYGKDSEMVKGWRKALWQGGDMIGILLSQGQDEGSVIREVVKKILKKLGRVPLEVAKHPVGIDRNLEALRPLLHVYPHESNVYMIGIVGEGGMGKTTISKAICNDIADRFDEWCFLPNVREASRVVNGLALLQQALLRELLNDKELVVRSVDAGKQLIPERLCNKRVLLVLDDLDELAQFDALAGNLSWFGKGSRIIVTTRNAHLLISDRVQHVYKVSLLDKAEADSLFRLHAFGESRESVNIGHDLIERFVGYASRLPLALVVLGAFLRERSPFEWEGKLKELEESPDGTINSVLRISFDGLEDKHKEIFLNVACFFKGWHIHEVEKILDSCGFTISLGIKILIERCLVTVDGGIIQTHDLLGVMGESIARDDYSKGVGPRSRIWLYEDFLEILSTNTVQEKHAVKYIVLNLTEKKGGLVETNALMGFKNLQVFIARNVDGPHKLLWMPGELRWLEWQGYSAPSIEFGPSSRIVSLDLEQSKITKITGKGFKELKYVNLLNCYSLATLPDLSKSLKLEDLNLGGCSNLTVINEAIGSLEHLIHLRAGDCFSLAKVPSLLRSKNLQTLALWGCKKLDRLPGFDKELKFLQELTLSGTALKELPESIGNLVALEKLHMSSCEQLSVIPSSIYKLRAIEEICFLKCPKLGRFPRRPVWSTTDVLGLPNLVVLVLSGCNLKDLEFLTDLTCFETLYKLDLSHNEFVHVPACLNRFKKLEMLLLRDCMRLVEVPELPSDPMRYVVCTGCHKLRTFPSLHTFICRSPRFFEVNLSNCRGLGRGYFVKSLPLEVSLGLIFLKLLDDIILFIISSTKQKVRGFTGAASVVCPASEIPQWVNFQTTECGSRYRVSLPRSMSEDDLLGLAFFVTVECGCISFEDLSVGYLKFPVAEVVVGGKHLRITFGEWEEVYTWFVYIPYQAVKGDDPYAKLNWSSITLEFPRKEDEVGFCWWGMRMLCKREEDDQRIRVHKIESNESDSSESEYESAYECLWESDYESAPSEWSESLSLSESDS